MTLAAVLRIVLGGLLLILMAATVWWAATCHTNRKYADRPPEVIEPEDIEEGLVHEPPSVLERIYIRELQPVRSGTAPGAVAAEVDSFVAAAVKPKGKPKFPPVRGSWHDGRLTLAVGRSDGALTRNEYECPAPAGCDWYTADTTMAVQQKRAIPRLLPQLFKGAAVCVGVAAAGAGIAIAADYQEPLLVAGVAGGSCAVLKTVF